MKFLVDAHLPPSLCRVYQKQGHHAVHISAVAEGNRAKDSVLNAISIEEHRVVISKDTDFYYSHLLHGRPWKLLFVRTGNIGRRDLCDLFERNLREITEAFDLYSLVEISQFAISPLA